MKRDTGLIGGAAMEPADRYFVNLYAPGIGGSLGSVFPTREVADRAASGHRRACIEVAPISADRGLKLSRENLALLEKHAQARRTTVESLVAESVACFVSLHPEVVSAARRYAAETGATFGVVIAEATRAYFGGSR
ncbi:hypothetical protein DYI24_00250 [Rhodopseudomonas sp. BR0C11]|uniref:hypothetical protein n=1 Tax=Rhodopseudomonas sp. BR0C11 TaxID=2269370 RepID=UPI0013E00270|nr:hypothetical protein [Rhodopseudomonas sp. BR0C11]NEV75512.1 hypothetical protein [Rhodopseudomonas sp. BR0C11]